ncbi:MAG: hypothetical protein P4L83_11370 [Nevskia sp.]|nr:hypothetical protein [Nevskia sp.]
MRYALHRHHARTQGKRPEAPAPKQGTPKPAQPRTEATRAKPVQAAPPPVDQRREIVLGSNEGIRTVKVRPSTVIWHKSRKAQPPAGQTEIATAPATSQQHPAERRPVLSFKKPTPAVA